MKRMLLTAAAVGMAALLLTGCASKSGNLVTNPSSTMQINDAVNTLPPEGTDNMMPDVSMEPVIPGNASGMGVTSVDAARRVVEQIEDELERLSEVTDAQVMAAGDTAVVALRFDNQYRAGVDERMRRMVEERIKGIVAGVDRVYVTEETEHFNAINDLGDRLEMATDLAEIRQELNRMISLLNPSA